MAKWCPLIKDKVLYTECLECDEKLCTEGIDNTSRDNHEDQNSKEGVGHENNRGDSARSGADRRER